MIKALFTSSFGGHNKVELKGEVVFKGVSPETMQSLADWAFAIQDYQLSCSPYSWSVN